MKLIKYILLFSGTLLIIISLLISNKKIINNSLNGTWLEESGSLFIFKDNYFYWYKDYNNLNDNYYKGKIDYKTIDKYNYSDYYIKKNYGNIDKKSLYIIKLYPSILVKDGYSKKIDSSYGLSFELLLNDNKYEADMYNKNFQTIYKIIKYEN